MPYFILRALSCFPWRRGRRTNSKTAVSSKWIKTKVLAASPMLSAHIPMTLRLSNDSLERMLSGFGMVYVKPESGSCGVGVMKVERAGGKWVVQSGRQRKTFGRYAELIRWLRWRMKGKPYLVQRGIRMIRRNSRPIDFRVMIQKGRKVGWKVTGTAARVAFPGKAVTNGSQGGSIHGTEAILRETFGPQRSIRILNKFDALAHATALRFSRVYPKMRELGLDIAVDRRGRCWILEVNTRPDPCPFTKLSDPSMLRTIVKFAREYGRTYNLTCRKARRGGG
ncbi:YheC/YheD family protein [Cohnella terricola]|uniref:YheC/YheD family protein n=1 Tax=Cohnella terricola TaxID=1289167 RepID=A0A559JAH0_9BACL|nr:YheC/YheD family protein [Cohnella terricola]TVX96862.1 YheC/YheD family protein [Cohnella terricola]